MYIKNCGDKSVSDLLLPVPEPGDIERASTVSFESVQSQIDQLQKDLNGQCNIIFRSAPMMVT